MTGAGAAGVQFGLSPGGCDTGTGSSGGLIGSAVAAQCNPTAVPSTIVPTATRRIVPDMVAPLK
jgi:hypothetical protein